MNLFRRVFIYLFVASTLILSVYAGMQLWREALPFISWLGLLLTTAPLWLFVIFKGICPEKIQAEHAFGISCICGLGVAISMASSWKYGYAAGTVHLWAGACFLAWVLYLKRCKAIH